MITTYTIFYTRAIHADSHYLEILISFKGALVLVLRR